MQIQFTLSPLVTLPLKVIIRVFDALESHVLTVRPPALTELKLQEQNGRFVHARLNVSVIEVTVVQVPPRVTSPVVSVEIAVTVLVVQPPAVTVGAVPKLCI